MRPASRSHAANYRRGKALQRGRAVRRKRGTGKTRSIGTGLGRRRSY